MKKKAKTIWGVALIAVAAVSFLGHVTENKLNGIPWYIYDANLMTAFTTVGLTFMLIVGGIMLLAPWKDKAISSICTDTEDENYTVPPAKTGWFSIAAFVLGIIAFLSSIFNIYLVIPLASIILAIVGIKKAYKEGQKGKALAKWALTMSISSIMAILFVVVTIAIDDSSLESDYVSDNKIWQEETTIPYSKGIVTDTTYESEFIGIKFETPEGWRMKTQNEIIELYGEAYSEQVEMMTVHPDTNTAICLFAEKMPLKNVDVDQYKAAAKQNLENTGMKFLEDKGTVTISGEDYELLQFSVDASLGIVKTDIYVMLKGERAVYFMVTYLEENQTLAEACLNSFKKYND